MRIGVYRRKNVSIRALMSGIEISEVQKFEIYIWI